MTELQKITFSNRLETNLKVSKVNLFYKISIKINNKIDND